MENVLNLWSNRLLTLMGKVQIVNTLCESLFVYHCGITLDATEELLKHTDRIINNFLWKSGRAHITQDTLHAHKLCGGLRLFCLAKKQAALKIRWVLKLHCNPFFESCFREHTYFPNMDIDMLFKCNISYCDVKKYVDPKNFWGQVMIHWCQYHYYKPQTGEEVKEQIIWLNSNIQKDGNPFYIPGLVQLGLHKIKDFMDKDGTFKSYECLLIKTGDVI